MTDQALILMKDLLRLLRKHGAEAFEELASMLADPDFAVKATAILRGVVKVSPAARRPDPEQASPEAVARREELLATALARVTSIDSYPNLRRLADDLARLGISVPPSGFRRRDDAARAITRYLGQAPLEEVIAFVEALSPAAPNGALQEWSQIIMDRNR